MSLAIFPIIYCPPISWFAAACQESEITLEVMQPYRKQLYTNRTYIRISNQVMMLSIPIERRSKQVPIKEKRISYQERWQKQHARSIHYAYQNSPFYSYYLDHFSPFYNQPFEWLYDYNLKWLESLFQLLKKEMKISLNEQFEEKNVGKKDFRNDFDPTRKQNPAWFVDKTYPQVFEGFESNLSIIDLLCNEGPNSVILLNDMFDKSLK